MTEPDNSKPRRRFFVEPGDQADSTPAAPEPTAAVRPPAGKQRPGPKPKPEASPRVVWGYRARPEHKNGVEAMLNTAPRHVKLQDLMDYIMADFLTRNPELPEQLRTSPPQ